LRVAFIVHGSFSADGTIKPSDSLPLYGILHFDGSLLLDGTFHPNGSLLDVGTLDYDGSLSRLETI